MREAFIRRNFQDKVRDIIDKANKVIEDYVAQGLTLTVRQLYYRFIAFDLFPDSWIDVQYNLKHGLDKSTKNTLKNYKRLADALDSGRQAGLIDWSHIEDRTRWLREYAKYADPAQKLGSVPYEYGEALWRDQDTYCEVWVEKDALLGVIEGPCGELQVPHFPTRGFVSQSEAYSSGQRIGDIARSGKKIVIFHLGDHDPSGLDMSRDIEERLMLFARQGNIDFRRLALNMDQVQQYNPPPNPAKETDSRFAAYKAEFGDVSWELDALEPKVIQALLRENIEALIHRPSYDKAVAEQEANRSRLIKLSEHWDEVTTLLDWIEIHQ